MEFRIYTDTVQSHFTLNQLLRHLRDLSPLMQGIAFYLENSTIQRFYDEKDPNGNNWQALLPKTLKVKNGAGTGSNSMNGILKHSGSLVRSITSQFTNNRVEVGTNLIYANVHQWGWTAKNIPARPFLGLSLDDRQEIENLTHDFVAEAFR